MQRPCGGKREGGMLRALREGGRRPGDERRGELSKMELEW